MDGLAVPPLDQLCQSIRNTGKKTRMLQVNMSIKNNSSQEGGGLEVSAYKTNGQRALTCIYGGRITGGAFSADVALNANHPEVISDFKMKPNESGELIMRIFMENNENASYIVVRDTKLGSSNTVGLPGSNAAPPATAPQPTAVSAASGSYLITKQSSGYEQWGRPAGMSNPNAGCGGFNNAQPVRKFNISVRVTNNTSATVQPLAIKPIAIKGDGSKAYVCFYGHSGVVNALAPGQSIDITYAAFVELNEYVSSFYVENEGVKSNTLTF